MINSVLMVLFFVYMVLARIYEELKRFGFHITGTPYERRVDIKTDMVYYIKKKTIDDDD